MTDKRKMAFYEINQGLLAEEMQRSFENAQLISYKSNCPTEVVLKIKIYPAEDRKFGKIQYAISEKLPAKSSIKLTTEITADGIIISDGKNELDILQEELQFLDDEKIHKITINK